LNIVGYLVSTMFVTLEYETFYMLLAMSAVVGRALPHTVRFAPRDALLVGAGMGSFFVLIKTIVMIYK